jgi:ketosteroid isomerase-like protein
LLTKKILILVFVFVSFTSFSQSNDEIEIRKVLASQNDAWNRGDVDAFMVGYWDNDSLMFIGSSGVTYGYKNTLANYKKRYPDTVAMGKLIFTLIEIKRLSSEYYHVTGKWNLQRSVGDVSGHFTLVFRKVADKWVIISDHSS